MQARTERVHLSAGPIGSTGFCDKKCCDGVCAPELYTGLTFCCAPLPRYLGHLPVAWSDTVTGSTLLQPPASMSQALRAVSKAMPPTASTLLYRLHRPQRLLRILQPEVLPVIDGRLRPQRQRRWSRLRSLLCAADPATPGKQCSNACVLIMSAVRHTCGPMSLLRLCSCSDDRAGLID